MISSLPRADTPLQSDSTSILARPVAYDGISGLVPCDNPFGHSGEGASSSRGTGGESGVMAPSGAATSMITQVSNHTEFLLTLAM